MFFSIFFLLPLLGITFGQEYGLDPTAYQFSYSTGDSGPAKMFREEQRSASGQVTGKYGYVDPYGHMRIVQYEAGPQGFIARGDTGPDREAMRIARQLAEQDYKEKLPFLQQWNQVAARLAAGPSWNTIPAPTWTTAQAPATWSSAQTPTSWSPAQAPAAVPPPSPSSVERARLVTSSAPSWSTGGAGHSFSTSINHYTSNIDNVWPSVSTSRSAALLQAPQFTGAPHTFFTMTNHGPQPYNINYAY